MRVMTVTAWTLCWVAAGVGAAERPAARFSRCQKAPPGKKIALTLRADTDISDLIGWASAMTCRTIIAPEVLQNRKVRLIVPEPVTAEVAYGLFLSALHSVGLTVMPSGAALILIEASRAHESAPVYIGEDALPVDDPQGRRAKIAEGEGH